MRGHKYLIRCEGYGNKKNRWLPQSELEDMVISMPDALSMEIALIALLLFKLQVYSTSLHHYYNRPITLSTFQLLYQSTIHHMASINTLQLPQEVLLSTRLALLRL
jgi:hypothetical protein